MDRLTLTTLRISNMAKKNCYAVANGRTPGIYHSCDECTKQVKGYHSALYKGFKTESEARSWLASLPSQQVNLITPCYLVDVARQHNTADCSCRVMHLPSKDICNEIRFRHHAYVHLVEYEQIVSLLAMMQNSGESAPIYTCNTTVFGWLFNKQQKSSTLKNPGCPDDLRDRVFEADAWLKSNPKHNEVFIWNRMQWGCMPIF